MEQVLKNKLSFGFASILSLLMLNCSSSSNEQITTANLAQDTVIKKSNLDLNRFPMTKTVCDPFTQQPGTNLKKGLKANLSYAITGTPRYYSSKDYVEKTWQSDKTLFFSQLSVPTRLFNTGFITESGDVLQTDQGTKLVEFFGIKFQSSLALSEADEDGLYDLALLSDDGSTLNLVTKPGTEEVLINNDGDHPTRMGCSNKYLNMKKGQKFPFVLTYYQGPRYHIANVLIWRRVDTITAPKDSSCGLTGNNTFYDPDHGSTPQNALLALQSRGWKVVQPDNFILEDVRDYNPCVPTVAPVISDFRLNETTLSEAWFSWTTDLPASSQLLVTEVGGSQILTASDNNLRMTHSLRVEGLKSMTTYKVKAISLSEDLGRGESEEIQFTTP